MQNKLIQPVIVALSIAVPVLVAILFVLPKPNIDAGFDVHIIPTINALINTCVAFCLSLGFYYIKSKQIKKHRVMMFSAFALSSLFLILYVIYHSLSEPTKYGGVGILKILYYFILLSHILLSAIIVPFVLFTIYYAISNQIDKHRKLAKYTFPMWMYVAVTGVLAYIFISPYYN